jgi:subtilisin family serine protease
LQNAEEDASASLSMADEAVAESSPGAEENVTPDMDPTLQYYCVKKAQGIRKLKTASTHIDEVAVIARVIDDEYDNFDKLMNEVKGRIGVKIPPNSQDHEKVKTSIVTARIPIDSVERVRAEKKIVMSLKASRRLKSALFRTVRDIGAIRDEGANSLPKESLADGGRDVIIGIVDVGLNLFHEKFRNKKDEGETTRILSFWNQSADPDVKEGELGERGPYGYGRVFSKENIDKALKTGDPFKALNYNLFVTPNEHDGVHATPVADIAAGNNRGRKNQFGEGNPGIAPNADIVFVELSSSGIAGANPVNRASLRGDAALEASFADSAQLLEAIAYIFDFAKSLGKPCVVNISLGTHGGPHDGSTPIENAIDRLVSEFPNRAVVIAAGNFANEKTHASGTVSSEPFNLEWEVREGDPTGNELEIWYSGDDPLQVDIIAPGGEKVVKLNARQNRDIPVNGRSMLFAVHRIKDPNNDANLINLFLEKGTTPGTWTVRLSRSSDKDVDFHAWIERDHKGRSIFLDPASDVTLSSIACSEKAIVVGAYDAHTGDPARKVFPSSSSGPTRLGGRKPDISAPGVGIKAASFEGDLSRDATAVFPVDGTSMASAVVTGVVALMLSEARKRKIDLDIEQIRRILIEASRDENSEEKWDKQSGFGRISASKAIKKVIAMAPESAGTAQPSP